MHGANIFFFSPPTLQGFGSSNGYSLELQDKEGHSIDEFYKVSNDFLAALKKRPEIQSVNSSFNPKLSTIPGGY